jgi:hypothetical protein
VPHAIVFACLTQPNRFLAGREWETSGHIHWLREAERPFRSEGRVGSAVTAKTEGGNPEWQNSSNFPLSKASAAFL